MRSNVRIKYFNYVLIRGGGKVVSFALLCTMLVTRLFKS